MTIEEADIFETYLNQLDMVKRATVSEKTANAIIIYDGNKEALIKALSYFDYENCNITISNSNRALSNEYEETLYSHILSRIFDILFLPLQIRSFLTVIKAIPFIIKGIKSLLDKRIEVALLDATTISLSLLRSDFKTAGSIIFLLKFSDILEEWTHKKSVSDLANIMSLHVDKVWLKNNNEEKLVSIKEIKKNDKVVLRTSNVVPLDGIVVDGEVGVNEASMTGESLPVIKKRGDSLYAGTLIDEGECTIEVIKTSGFGRYDAIVKMIEESEKLKSDTESKAIKLSDRLVPYSFILTGIVYLITRNINKAMAILMVDYSCALKMSMPISVLSAIKEASYHHILVKGGKYLEAISKANTIVFDKTGTLTHSTPRVNKVVVFGDYSEDECLRIAACLEEHFPHSIANAVIKKAKEKGLYHDREIHSKVEYLVAHGIVSLVGNKRVIIGSYHFVFEDEKCLIPQDKKALFNDLPNEFSHLYMAIDGKLTAVILIEDPIRKEAKEVIASLYKYGIKDAVMMTGDSLKTAKAVAKKLEINKFFAEVLPEDKANFVREEHQKGHKVIMIGDGINDSLALSEADCGIAIKDGAMIAREVADVTIGDDSLYALLTLKRLADMLMKRIDFNYRFIMSFNTGLILLGIFGILPSTATAYMHNISTLLISLKSMTPLLKNDGLK